MPVPARYDMEAQATLPPRALDAWWNVFDDEQLRRLVEDALVHAPDARSALSRLDEARAVRAQAESRFRPQGEVEAGLERTQTENRDGPGSAVSRTASIALPVSWELDLWGRATASRRVAEADLAAARFSYEGARAALAAEVAQLYFQAQGFAAQWGEARTNLRIQRELVRVLSVQADRGITARAQVDRVSGELARIEAQALAVDAGLAAARRSLLILVGNGFAPLESVAVDVPLADPPAVPDVVPTDLLARRPDVREARARIEAAAGTVTLAELDLYPRLLLRPSVGATVQRGAIDATTGFWTLALGAAVPVLDRPRLNSALAVASARGEQAVLAFEQIVQTAYAEADRSLRGLASDRERVITLVAGERRSRRAFEAAETRFQRGLGGLEELLDAELAWRTARSALVSARIDALQRSVQVFKALGGGWTPPLDLTTLPTDSNR